MAIKSTPFPPPPTLSLPGCGIHPFHSFFLPSLSLPLLFLQPTWFLMVGGDRSFKLALTEKNEEFSDELREDCEVKGDGR